MSTLESFDIHDSFYDTMWLASMRSGALVNKNVMPWWKRLALHEKQRRHHSEQDKDGQQGKDGQQQKSPLTAAPPLPRAVAAASKAGEKEKESEEEEEEDDDEDEAASYEDDQHIMRERTRMLFCFISQKVAEGAVAVASVDSPHNSHQGLPTAFFEMHMPDIIKECDGFYFGRTADSARKDWNSCKKRWHAVSWAVAMAGKFHEDQEVRRQEQLSDYHHRMKELSMQRAVAKTKKAMMDSESAELGLLLKKQRLAKAYGTYHKDVIKYLASTATTSKRLNDCDDGNEDGNNVTLARLFGVKTKVMAKDKLKQTKLQKFLRPHNIAEKYSSDLGKKKMTDVRAEEYLEEISDNDDSHVSKDEASRRHLSKRSLQSTSAVFKRGFVEDGDENSEESEIFKRGFVGDGDENSEVILIDD
ncbi:hypothetical protein niasHT_003256 [Heterodera trifolii]|uniref:Uncharacterized protein n=1 Tax=Heterodera trifolii TaxID=157864 RepID=A0ABD2LS30_9BILA